MRYELEHRTEVRRKMERRAGRVVLAGGCAVAAFWILFFTGVVDGGSDGSVVHEFEMAFPLADAVFAGALFTAGITLLRGLPAGPFFLVAAGAMSIYLGLLDVTFYGRQGVYFPISGAGLFELALNTACIGGGAYALRHGWRLWQRLPQVLPHRSADRRSPKGLRAAPRPRRRRLEVA